MPVKSADWESFAVVAQYPILYGNMLWQEINRSVIQILIGIASETLSIVCNEIGFIEYTYASVYM